MLTVLSGMYKVASSLIGLERHLSCSWLSTCSASLPYAIPSASLLVLAALGAVHVDTRDWLQGSPQDSQLVQRLACVLQRAQVLARAHFSYSKTFLHTCQTCVKHSMQACCWGLKCMFARLVDCNSLLH